MPILDASSLVVDAVCWDKDRFGKDYMGEFGVAVEEIFADKDAVQEVGTKIRSKVDNTKHKDSLVGIRWSRDDRNLVR